MPNQAPLVHFLCTHSPGTLMAVGFFNHLAASQAIAWAGDGGPSADVNPAVVAAMAEVGIDISDPTLQPLMPELPHVADVVIASACDGNCALFLGERYAQWDLADTAGKPIAAIRPIRDDIERRVRTLLTSLDVKAVDHEYELT